MKNQQKPQSLLWLSWRRKLRELPWDQWSTEQLFLFSEALGLPSAWIKVSRLQVCLTRSHLTLEPWFFFHAGFQMILSLPTAKWLGFQSCLSCHYSAYKASSWRWDQLLKASPHFVGTSKQDLPLLVPPGLSRDTLFSWLREWRKTEVVLGYPLPRANPEPRICVQGVYWENAPRGTTETREGVDKVGYNRVRSQATQPCPAESPGV